jgi:hypothetical protein
MNSRASIVARGRSRPPFIGTGPPGATIRDVALIRTISDLPVDGAPPGRTGKDYAAIHELQRCAPPAAQRRRGFPKLINRLET